MLLPYISGALFVIFSLVIFWGAFAEDRRFES
jgi:hypothetical protein